jgi:hypothetical protein
MTQVGGTPDAERVEAQALDALRQARQWPAAVERDGIRVAHGRIEGAATRLFHSCVSVDADLDRVARYLADEMVERLPEWSDEFVRGESLAELPAPDGSRRWVFLVRYATPPPLRDREYHYWLQRRDVGDDEVVITYESIDGPVPSPGCVRASLHRTIHRLTRQAGRTRIEHLLGTGLGGLILPWMQSNLLTAALVKAHERDATAIRRNLTRPPG